MQIRVLLLGLTVAAALSANALAADRKAEKKEKPAAPKLTIPATLYDECTNTSTPPYAASGWMGATDSIEVDNCCTDDPHVGNTCFRFTFNGGDWGGLVWQDPANDWGDEEGGYDLTGARKVTFWARGEKGGEKATFKMGIYPRTKAYPDSGGAGTPELRLKKEWKQYSISLTSVNLKCIKSGFSWTTPGARDPVTIYVDDIRYE
jgi:hypothetical protein